jgi:CheY-like chemotaxis protein
MKNHTLMVIDDEEDLLDIIEEQIELSGIKVSVIKCSNVQAALNNIDQCDIILSDINMPQKDQLEEMLAKTNKPIARITGNDEVKCSLTVLKPFNSRDLEKVIYQLINLSNHELT